MKKGMKNKIAELTAIGMMAVMSSQAHAEGSGNSGGGSGVVLKDGSVRLVDTLSSPVNVQSVADDREITSLFFEQDRYVKTIAQKDEHFFDCAVEKISKTNVPFKTQWIQSLNEVRVLSVEFPLATGASQIILDHQPLPYYADRSENVGDVHQVALAAYSQGDLWVQKRFYGALSQSDQCALGVHEAIRHLNYTILKVQPMSTSQIEEATRSLINEQELANQQLVRNYLAPKEIGPVLELYHTGIDLVEKMRMTESDQQRQYDLMVISLKMRDMERATIRAAFTPQSTANLCEAMRKVAKAINEYQLKYWDVLSSDKHHQLSKLEMDYLLMTQDLNAGMMTFMVEAMPLNLFQRVFTGVVFTEKLPGLKKFDVQTLKFVNRF